MNIGANIYRALSTNEALTTLIGNKIFPVFIPQGASMPAIIYDILYVPTITKERNKVQERCIVTILVKHIEYPVAHQIADICDEILDKRGRATIGGQEFQYIAREEKNDQGWGFDSLTFDISLTYVCSINTRT